MSLVIEQVELILLIYAGKNVGFVVAEASIGHDGKLVLIGEVCRSDGNEYS